jgi:hypothetical protein
VGDFVRHAPLAGAWLELRDGPRQRSIISKRFGDRI